MHKDVAHPVETTENRPRVAVLLTPERRQQVLSEVAERLLASFATVVAPEGPGLDQAAVPALLDGAVACLTGWGTPPLGEDVLTRYPELRLIAHTAGSIRRLVPLSALEKGLRVTHAAAAIADAVAELVVSQLLTLLRQLPAIDRDMKARHGWEEIRTAYPGRLLGSQSVGVVGTGRVGRAVIHLLKAFGCHVRAYDPYLTDEQAREMGIEAVGLNELLSRSDIVTLHAPVLPETEGMIGAEQLAMLHDHAIFVNAARATLVDEAALYRELTSGRIRAVLDVFSQEPLPLDSPFRQLPDVLISPHAAGHTLDTHLRQGQAMVEEIQRFLRGEALRYEVTAQVFPILA